MDFGNRRPDGRIEKTKGLLQKALAILISEKNYSAIVVREILTRANVGRTAFYTHFRDKDDLLVSSIHDLLRSARKGGRGSTVRSSEDIIWFSLPIFEYHYQHRHHGPASHAKKADVAPVHEKLRKILVSLVAEDVDRTHRMRDAIADKMPGDVLVEYVASTYILVLNWWVGSEMAMTPKEVDHMFRKLVLPCLRGVVGE